MSLAQTLVPSVSLNAANQRGMHVSNKMPMNNTMNMHAKLKSELPTGKDIFSKRDAFGNNINSSAITGTLPSNNRASRKTRINSNNLTKFHQGRGESNTRNNTSMTTG